MWISPAMAAFLAQIQEELDDSEAPVPQLAIAGSLTRRAT